MHASDLQKIIDLMEKHELGRPAVLGSFSNGPSSSGVGVAGGSGSCPSSASSGAVEAKCQQEAEAVQAGKMVLKTEALVLSDCDSDGIPSNRVSFW